MAAATEGHNLTLATDHPQFDEVGELLCILPHHPNAARVDEVAEDFGFASERSITALARRAQAKGHDIRIKNDGRSPIRRISVVMPDGGTSFRDAMSYWNSVYQDIKG